MCEKTVGQILTDSLDNEGSERERERERKIKKRFFSMVHMSNTGQFLSAKAQMKISLGWVSAYQLPLKEKLSHFAMISGTSSSLLAFLSCIMKYLPVIKFT